MDAITSCGVIENAGPNDLRGFLKRHLKPASGVDIGVAFVTRAGLAELLLPIRKAATNGQVRLLTGLYQYFTEPEALRNLLTAQIDTKGRISVRLSPNRHFHWKSYFIFNGRYVKVVVGSSNLTTEGLGGSGELNALVSLKRDSTALRVLHKPFEKEWARAVPLNPRQIRRYAEVRSKVARVQQPTIPLAQILGPVRVEETKQDAPPQYWRDTITGLVKPETEDVISDMTNWDERGYGWYSSGEGRHRVGDHIILFDRCDKSVRLVTVVDTAQTPVMTPDGRQFTAYRQRRGTHRRRLPVAIRLLRQEGMIRGQSGLDGGRLLTVGVFTRFQEALSL